MGIKKEIEKLLNGRGIEKKEKIVNESVFYDCNLPEQIEGYRLIELSEDIYRYEKINKEVLTLKLNMNYVCKNTIKQRKKVYGDSFKEIAKLESEFLGIKITPSQVAYKMAILKQVRINFIKAKLQEIKNTAESFDDIFILNQIKELNNGLEDSLKDYSNYLFISQNYAEYEAL